MQELPAEPIFQEIKFRLLNTSTGKCRTYSLSELIGKTYRRGQFRFRGRFTGLKDKNGKEIYEGDLLREEYGGIYKVVFGSYEQDHEGWTRDCGRWVEEGTGWHVVSEREWFEMTLVKDDGWEVVGNIYENPELLPAQGVEDV